MHIKGLLSLILSSVLAISMPGSVVYAETSDIPEMLKADVFDSVSAQTDVVDSVGETAETMIADSRPAPVSDEESSEELSEASSEETRPAVSFI